MQSFFACNFLKDHCNNKRMLQPPAAVAHTTCALSRLQQPMKAQTKHSNGFVKYLLGTRLEKCRRLYLTVKTALALELPAERLGEECKAQEGGVNVLMTRLRQELLHAADIVCAPFCAGRLLDTLLGSLQGSDIVFYTQIASVSSDDVSTHKDTPLAKSRGRC